MFNYTSPAAVYFGEAVPKRYEDKYKDIIRRAVDLLNIEPEQSPILAKKKSELEMIVLSLCPEECDPNYIVPENEKLEGYRSHAKILFQNLNSIELEPDDEFSWPQYFGLLALMEIHQDFFMSCFEDDMPDHIKALMENTHLNYLLASLEAVCFGEVLGPELPTQGIIKDKLSKQAQNAIRIRYQPLNDIKFEFLEFYLNSKDKSNKSEIARKYYRNLSEEHQRVLTSTLKIENACRTLINHLNKLILSEPFNRYS